jgi:glutamate-ammonia-ligase adenylyltransferase
MEDRGMNRQHRWPAPANEAAAARLIDEYTAKHGPPGEALTPLLLCLGGNSPYLSDLALREGEQLRAVLADGPEAVCRWALRTLADADPALPRAGIARLLRQAKRRVALATAVADIGGIWPLEQVTDALSRLADSALVLSVDHLLRASQARGELRAGQAGRVGFVVLAMGKLGARALNFSSDIDLVLLFDPEAHPYNADGLSAIFSRLAHDLAGLIQVRDSDGYVFRVDFRLRPDPGSTPPAMSLPMALAYYEGQAQTWERAAMIKARPVAGDLALGRRFLEAIRPFVWRRQLDFAAIADIRAMKLRMDSHRGATLSAAADPAAALLGHDMKLGQGGIREVEFCAQMLQLVWGGRDTSLRVPGTLAALGALANAGHLPGQTVARLEAAYRFLRSVEHRLQMVHDRQTHTLPADEAGLAAFALFMGMDKPSFAATLLKHLLFVRTTFAGLLKAEPVVPDNGDTASMPQQALPDGKDPPWASWLQGRPRSMRSERARALLAELLPAVIAAMERQPQPELAWARLDELVYRLPSGVQVFSLIRHNPALLERLGDVLGAAPALADHLANVPSALEGLLSPHDIDPDPAASLHAQLGDARGLDEALAVASRMVRGEEFRLALAELDGRIGADAAGLARTALADAAMSALLPLVSAEHVRRFGRVRGGGIVVVALGKAGSREMMAGSDLDLMLVYDHPPEVLESTGSRPLAASQYFARQAQALVSALTVPTRDGKLYDVDMRLRPSGSKGPVAVSLAALERYHREDAWTWERLALTRARVVAGPARLRRRVEAAIGRALRSPGRGADIRADTRAMRLRVLHELPPRGPWDVKLRAGGLLDVEFCAQALQLMHASRPGVLQTVTRDALAALARAGVLPAADTALLVEADHSWRAIQGLLRIMAGRVIPETLSPQVAQRIAGVTGLPAGEEAIASRLDDMAAGVREVFRRYIGETGQT